jgi:hypothetical protein
MREFLQAMRETVRLLLSGLRGRGYVYHDPKYYRPLYAGSEREAFDFATHDIDADAWIDAQEQVGTHCEPEDGEHLTLVSDQDATPAADHALRAALLADTYVALGMRASA